MKEPLNGASAEFGKKNEIFPEVFQANIKVVDNGSTTANERMLLTRNLRAGAFREVQNGLGAGSAPSGQNLLGQDQLAELPPGQAFERHFSPAVIAKQWGLSLDLIHRIFDNEPGVIKLGRDESRHHRRYFTLRVPESVMRRAHRRLTQTCGKAV